MAQDVEYKFVAGRNWISNGGQPTVSLPSLTDGTNMNNIFAGHHCGGSTPGALSSSAAR